MAVALHKKVTAAVAGGTISLCVTVWVVAVGVGSQARPEEQSFWPYPWLIVPALVATVAGVVWLMIGLGLTGRAQQSASAKPSSRAPASPTPDTKPWTANPTPPVHTRQVSSGRWHVVLTNGKIVGSVTRDGGQFRAEGARGLYGTFATFDMAVDIVRRQLNP